MSGNGTSVGLDVHARSVVACGVDGRTGQMFERRLTPDHGDVVSWLRSLPGPVTATYDSGPTGFGLARCLVGHRIEPSLPGRGTVEVAAPVRGSGQTDCGTPVT